MKKVLGALLALLLGGFFVAQAQINYEVRDGVVYNGDYELDFVDVDSFEDLGEGYMQDTNGLYWGGNSMDKPWDKDSFEVLSNGFAKDMYRVFKDGTNTSLDAASFSIFSDNFVSDVNGLYFLNNLMGGFEFVRIGDISDKDLTILSEEDENKYWILGFDGNGDVHYGTEKVATDTNLHYLGGEYATGEKSVYYRGSALGNFTVQEVDSMMFHAGSSERVAPWITFDGGVIISGMVIRDMDPETFVSLGHTFAKDKDSVVYLGVTTWMGPVDRVVTLEDADPATFEVLEHGYVKDAQHTFVEVFDENISMEYPAGYIVQPEGDAASYKVHDVFFQTDADTIFFFGKAQLMTEGVELDQDSFKVLARNIAMDDTYVYQIGPKDKVYEIEHNGSAHLAGHYIVTADVVYVADTNAAVIPTVLEGADPETFEGYMERGWDKNTMYLASCSTICEATELRVDGATLEILDSSNYKDKNGAYYFDNPVYGADTETYELVRNNWIAKDKNSLYFNGQAVDQNVEVSGFKPAPVSPTNTLYESISYFVSDNHVYALYRDSGDTLVEVEGADPKTFMVLGGTDYQKDATNAYYQGRPIEGADPKTFEELGAGYAKDKDAVYYEDRVVPGAYADSFYVRDGNIAKDEYNTYKNGVHHSTMEVFSDIDSSHPYYNAILTLKDSGTIQGYADGTFGPERTINRAEFLKILLEGGVGKIQNCDDDFGYTDVVSTEWYAQYVQQASCMGAVQGYPDKSFRPGATINYAEAAKITIEFFPIFPDTTDVWYEGYLNAIISRNAQPRADIMPGDSLTRGEMAQLIHLLNENL